MTAFETTSQRVAASYQRQLTAFAPVLPAQLPELERQAGQASQKDLHGFFAALYRAVYADPAVFGLPVAEDVCVDAGDGKDRKRYVANQIKKARTKLEYGIDFLWLLGRLGTLIGDDLRLECADYAAYLTKGLRVKRKFLSGLSTVGLTATELGDAVIITNARFPAMLPALKSLAGASLRFDDQRLAKFLFARCDLRMLDADYRPDPLEVLHPVLRPSDYEHALELHRILVDLAYVPTLGVGGPHDWRIHYQGRRAIKSTPFFEFEYDERRRHQLEMQVKCAAANRLVPLLSQQTATLQADFFHHASRCGGASCGWCKTRKALGPSKLEHEGETKTVCWYMRRRFTELDDVAVELVKQYAQLHEALAAA